MANNVLSVEITGNNTDLKRSLEDSKAALQAFKKQVESSGNNDLKKELNDSRIEAIKFASDLKASLGESLNNVKKRTEDAKQATESYKQSLLSAKSEVENSRKATEAHKSALEQQKKATEAERTALAATRSELALISLEKRKSAAVTTAAAGSYREAQQRLTALGKSIREAKGGFDATNPSIKAQVAEYEKLNSKLKEFDKTMGNNQRNVGNYPMLFASAIPQIAGIAAAVESGNSKMVNFTAGLAAFAGVSNAIGAATRTIFDFNSGMKNVEKTTGLSSKEVTKLGDEFVALSRKLETVSSKSLTEYGTIAGQLGVKGTENILNFSEALAKLSTASNISGEQGGAEIARMLTLVDGGVQNVKKFADEIVNLGNNFAATEKEILSNAEAIAQNVGIYDIGRQEILAFATATKAVGIEAELVGSTFNRTLAVLENAIRTGNGVSTVMKLVGGTQAELSKRFREDASGVFVDFIKGLNGIQNAGGSVKQELEQLSINAVRDQRVIESLAVKGYGTLTKALDTVKDSVGATDREFTTANEKLVNQVGKISVAWDNLVLNIESGEGAIGKSLAKVAGYFANTLDAITDLTKSDNFGDSFAAFSPIYMIDAALEKGRQKDNMKGRGESQYLNNLIAGTNQWNKSNKDSISLVDQVAKHHSKQTAIIKANEAEKTRAAQAAELAEGKKSKSGAKGKSQAEIIKEADEALNTGQRGELYGIDADMAKIDDKWSKIYEKINLINNVGLRNQRMEVAKLANEQEKYLKFLEAFAKSPSKAMGSGVTGLSGSLSAMPTSLPGLANDRIRREALSRAAITQESKEAIAGQDELSRYVTSSLRRGISQSLNGLVDDLTSLGHKSFEIEAKYNELRKDASEEQIKSLNKMEKLEKKVNNGFTNMLQSAVKNLSSVGANMLTSSLSEGISKGDLSGLSGLFKGDKKAMGYGALGSMAGGIIQGATSPKSYVGQGLGGALAGAGVGLMGGVALGAAAGSVVPVVGTIVGAAVGAIVGIIGASKANKQYELEQLQLAEQKKQTALAERLNALAYSSSIIGQMTNQGIVNSIDTDAFGNVIATIQGKDIQLVLDRTKNGNA